MDDHDTATHAHIAAPAPCAPAKPPATKKPTRATLRRLPPAAVPAEPAAEDTTMEDAINTATDKTQAMFADANARAKGAMEKGQQMFGEMNEFGKGNLEALVESSKIAARAMETLGQDAAAYAKKSFEDASAAARTLATVRSPAEFMKLQGDFMRQTFDAVIAETSRSTEAMLKLAGEVAQPISNRVALAAEKIKVGA